MQVMIQSYKHESLKDKNPPMVGVDCVGLFILIGGANLLCSKSFLELPNNCPVASPRERLPSRNVFSGAVLLR